MDLGSNTNDTRSTRGRTAAGGPGNGLASAPGAVPRRRRGSGPAPGRHLRRAEVGVRAGVVRRTSPAARAAVCGGGPVMRAGAARAIPACQVRPAPDADALRWPAVPPRSSAGVRRGGRACVVVRKPARRYVRPVQGALDRALVGVAVVLASATTVVLLGLLARLAAPGS